MRRDVDQGIDPLEVLQEEASAPTVTALWQELRAEHLPGVSAKHATEQERYWTRHILPRQGKKKLEALRSHEVDALHREISARTPVLANRALASLRKALNFAKRREWIDRNVAEGGRTNPEHGRQRYLGTAQHLRDGPAWSARPRPESRP